MAAASPLDQLPAELFAQLLRSIDSPRDLRSFIGACPTAFRRYMVHKSYILQPISRQLKIRFQATGQLSNALIAARLRCIQNDLPYLEPRQAQEQVWPILESPPLESSTWEINLCVICHLFRLSREADHCIARYADEAWAKVQDEAEIYAILEFTNYFGPLPEPPPLRRTPLLLSPSERKRLEEAFLTFDIYRHTTHYDTTILREVEIDWPIQMPIAWPWFIREGFQAPDWKLRAFQSIFSFIFNKYHFLVHRLTKRLERQRDSGMLLRSIDNLGPNRVWQFLQRTPHEELTFIAYLCSHGYFLLVSLEHMDSECLERFILTMFLWRCLPQAQSAWSLATDEALGSSLKALGTGVNTDMGVYNEPWTKGRYFGDRDRLEQLEDRAIDAAVPYRVKYKSWLERK
ncbi:hypothetical protein NM208_g6984 [Fusarium decemcellulare]|uniref:Uncharacterized protein n=1 Tax=Fusarium decemcellulare TaxID=57161 RepID=A0ACC1SAY2_9HYPO|nr:hypothetical protein NM208_g6984 [Fusarium decemcellulare]